jgi:lipopolysaccharide biosynthesis regulator YciM
VAIALFMTFVIIVPVLRRRGRPQHRARSELYRQVVEALVQKQPGEAVQLLRRIALDRTDDWNAQLLLGDLLRDTGHGEKALRIHQMLATSSPEDPEVRGRILESVARDLLTMGRHEHALKAARESLEHNRQHAQVWEVIWRAQDALGDVDAAWEALRNLNKGKGGKGLRLEGVPSLAEYRAYLGSRAVGAGDRKAARQHFKDALHLDPEFHVAKVFLGDVLGADGKEKEAIELWKDFSRRCPNEAALVFRRLEKTLFQLGRFGDLNAIYEEILAEDETHPGALAGLARMYLRRGMHDEADRCLQLLLERHPGDRQGRRLLMGSMLSSGKIEDAQRIMEEWVERDEPAHAVCRSCGHEESDLFVRCPRCGSWRATSSLALVAS